MSSVYQASSIILAMQVILLSCVAIVDVAVRLIPNRICLILAVLGTLKPLFLDPQRLTQSLFVAAILLLVLLPLNHRGWIGGGDVKLLTALSIGLPIVHLAELFTITALAGGVLASVHLTMRLLPYPSLPPVGSSLLRRVYAVERWRILRHAPLPYGVAIACGGMWIVLSHGV
jgi:prepilin peptidase CpaA